MGKLKKALIIVSAILLLALVWYVIPVRMLKADAADIAEIRMFNGNNGLSLTVSDRESVEYIVGELSGDYFRRGGLGGMGTMYRLTFITDSGSETASFALDWADRVRRGLFVYYPAEYGHDYSELFSYLGDLPGWKVG